MLETVEKTSVYQPEQKGLAFPIEREFASVEDERRHRKERLVIACRAFAREGYDYGFAGHLTVRDPERPELFWTNPMAVHFQDVRVSSLALVDHSGCVVEGSHAVNRAGFVLHANVHKAHPDIVSMCHAHTEAGTAFASLGRSLRPLTQDSCAFFEDHVVITEEAGAAALEDKAGVNVAQAFRGVKAAIHANHGLLTASRHSVDAAAFWFIAMERCCRQELLVDATGREPVLVSQERARYSRKHVGSDYIGWLHFQPIAEHLLRSQPDMLD
jgi:ribulose-5-phosphate 4-epimerase/fuculose-1-phosphate aldolase